VAELAVGVVFGGRSVEHDVSIVTAQQVIEVLRRRHDVVPIYITREGRWLSSPELGYLDAFRAQRGSEIADEAFIPPVRGYGGLMVPGGRLRGPRRIALDVVVPCVHGTYGEDGTLQGLLELADIPYTGAGVTGSAVGMDKVAMKAALTAAGLPVVPHTVVEAGLLEASASTVLDEVEAAVGYPAFVKPARLGSSVGIGRAGDRPALEGALEVARRYDRRLLVEPAMEGCIEVNCSVLGGAGRKPRVSVCEQPLPWEDYLSFSDKYMRGGKSTKAQGMASLERRIPAPISEVLTKKVRDNAIRAFRAVDAAGVARIDAFVKESTGETWVMEINTVPGSLSFYLWEATGTSFEDLVQEMIDVALLGHERKSDLMFSYDSGMLQRAAGAKQSPVGGENVGAQRSPGTP
jgi:D-alanine-D-alanine ligase